MEGSEDDLIPLLDSTPLMQLTILGFCAILVTGVAGFVGFHFARLPLYQGFHVVGLDNLNDYYDPA